MDKNNFCVLCGSYAVHHTGNFYLCMNHGWYNDTEVLRRRLNKYIKPEMNDENITDHSGYCTISCVDYVDEPNF